MAEAVTGGKTPGKSAMGLRVIRLDGSAADFGALAVRNVFRIVDVAVVLIGIVVMFFQPQTRRLGDLGAGTIVVRDRAMVTLAAAVAPPPIILRTPDAGPPIDGLDRIGGFERDALRVFLSRPGAEPEVAGRPGGGHRKAPVRPARLAARRSRAALATGVVHRARLSSARSAASDEPRRVHRGAAGTLGRAGSGNQDREARTPSQPVRERHRAVRPAAPSGVERPRDRAPRSSRTRRSRNTSTRSARERIRCCTAADRGASGRSGRSSPPRCPAPSGRRGRTSSRAWR